MRKGAALTPTTSAVIHAGTLVGMHGTRALLIDEADRVRVRLAKLVDEHGGRKGGQTAVSKMVTKRGRLAQQTISKIMNGGDVGMHAAQIIAEIAHVTLDELLHGETNGARTVRVPEDRIPLRAELQMLSAWREADDEVKKYLLDDRNVAAFGGLEKIDDWLAELRRAERLHRLGQLNALRPGEHVEQVHDPDERPRPSPRKKTRR